MKLSSRKIFSRKILRYTPSIVFVLITLSLLGTILKIYSDSRLSESLLKNELNTAKQETLTLQNQDQYKINKKLAEEMNASNKNYTDSIPVYEKLSDLKAQKIDTSRLDPLYAQVVQYLANRNYASASSVLVELNSKIEQERAKLAPPLPTVTAVSIKTSNDLPTEGLSTQLVKIDIGDFRINIIAADLNSTKVVVDTASDSDCRDNCPVMNLADYASRSGAWAAINGNFFCPADYPSCNGKVNSFDTLVMNKNKHYFNSDNNVYSIVPVAVFSKGNYRILGRSLDWGRDTSADAVIANYPQLVVGGNAAFSENPAEPKFGSKGARNFIAGKGNMVYIGTIYNATMGEAAQVLKALKVEDALNLDEGGSTALWFGGRYLAGPGRNIPNAVLFVRR